MASLNPNVALVSCPGCGAQYDFPASMAGERGRCAKCGQTFTVPQVATPPERLEDMPQYIGFNCHLCDTRMYGGPDQIGKELKCPDCGARTVLTRPEPKKKNIPAALGGEQYELDEPDVPSLPSGQLAHQPKYIAITCRKCDTLMYATEKQVGETITCPDCGRKQVVPARVKPKPKPSPMASDADTPMLDATSALTARPSALSPEARRKIYEEERDSEYGRALAESRRTGKPMKIDVRGRPLLPRWPLITGILPFLFSAHVPEWWLALTLGFMGGGYLISEGLIWGSQGGLAAISAMMFFVTGIMITLLVTAVCACVLKAIVTESSEGNNRVENWGTRYVGDWFPELLFLVMALFASLAPGGIAMRLAGGELVMQFLAGAAGAVVFFPIVYFSQLDFNSPWGVLSGRILTSLVKCAGSWIVFYFESALLFGVCLAAGIGAALNGIYPVLPFPLYVAALLLYARLMGRLAWRVAEALPEST
jgi:DNA-directed RNA polymerase subunit RPC12/RpoP